MIKSISITNFLCHKNTIITFDEGLSVLTGSSFSGKSALIDAIIWVIHNRPSGDSIRNWNCSDKDEISVSIEFDNCTVTKKRMKGTSWYELNSPDNKFEAVRTDVPDEIKELINLSEYNLRTQDNPYFLLDEPSGKIAEKLNELIGLDVIDTIFSNISSKLREAKAEEKFLQDNIKKTEESLERFKDLSQIEILVNGIAEKEKELDGLKSRTVVLPIIEKIKSCCVNIEREKEWLCCEQGYKLLREKLNCLWGIERDSDKLGNVLIKHNNAEFQIKTFSAKLKQQQKEYTAILEQEGICPLCKQVLTEEVLENVI